MSTRALSQASDGLWCAVAVPLVYCNCKSRRYQVQPQRRYVNSFHSFGSGCGSSNGSGNGTGHDRGRGRGRGNGARGRRRSRSSCSERVSGSKYLPC